jgi:epimerase transport system membrane fusion protein
MKSLLMTNSLGDTTGVLSVPTDDRRARRTGLVILLVTFAGFGGWAAVAKLDSAAVASGVVTVESYRKTIQHLEGGIVQDILVRDGDSVQSGDILLRLDDTQARARLEIIRSQYLAARALEARLIAERDQQANLAFPEELLSLRDDPRVRETLDGQERVFTARREALQGETALLEQRIEQLQAQISGLEVLQQTEQKRIDSLQRELQDFRHLQQSGYTDKLRLLELERDIAQLEGERAAHLAEIAKTHMQIGETKLQILQLRKQFQTEVVADLRDTQTKLFDLIERMRALQDTVERTEIRAPTKGTVVGLGVHTVGGVVAPATPLLEIVPKGEQLVVEAKVQPTDIDKVHPGLAADIRFTAFKLRTTPVVEGQVLTVSADRLIDPETKYPYYLARIQVTPQGMERLQGLELLPGMPAEVMIKTGERTLLNYLLRPLLDSFARSFRED